MNSNTPCSHNRQTMVNYRSSWWYTYYVYTTPERQIWMCDHCGKIFITEKEKLTEEVHYNEHS